MRQMKDSGYSWLGQIPALWPLKKGKYIFRQKSERGNSICLQLLSPTQNYGVIPQELYEELSGMSAVKLNDKIDLAGLKTVHRGAYIISLRSFQGGFEYSEYEGVVSPAYQVFYPTVPICNRYYKYMFKDRGFIEKMNSYTISLRDGKNIAFSDFGNTYIPLPPVPEQQRIADFLDDRCAEIDNLTADIQKEIEMMQEYRRSLITEAVTKGLDPDVKMKESGVDWLGEIPETWDLTRIKYCLSERKEHSVDGSEMPLSMSQKKGIIPTSEMDLIPNMAESLIGSKIAHVDDLVFNKLKAHLGVFSVSKYFGLVSPDYAVYYAKNYSTARFFEYLFKTKKYINEFKKRSMGVGAGLTRLYTSDLFPIHCALPKKEEIISIVTFLDDKCAVIDCILETKQKQLDTLAEYRKSVIYEYVTGKKEVV